MIHELKCWPQYFHDIAVGHKTFDVRKFDRGFVVGDELLLREWSRLDGDYTGQSIRRRIVYMQGGGQFGLAEDYVVLGLGPL